MGNNEELIAKVAEYEKEQANPDVEKKKKSRLKYFLNISLVLVITAAAIILTIWGKAETIFNNLMGADWRWLLTVFGMCIAGVMLRSLILFCFARLYTRDYHFHQAVAVDHIGTFYNAVTPGASGGQVMEAYTFKKQGIPISSAVSMLAMYSIMFQIVLILYGILSFIIKYDFIKEIGSFDFTLFDSWNFSIPIWPLTIIGFLLNLGVILIVLLMGYWKGFHNFVMGPVISLGAKLHIVKDPDKSRESLRIQVENFKVELRRMFSNIPFTILIFILFFVYMTVRFSIPYFVGQALGNESLKANFWDAVFLSNYHQMVTGCIPIPGSAGASEIFFKKLFLANNATATNSFFYCSYDWKSVSVEAERIYLEVQTVPNWEAAYELAKSNIQQRNSDTLASTALLLWRSVTFIFPLLIAGFVTAFYRSSPKKEAEMRVPDRQTFVDLQNETYEERSAELETILETNRLSREAIMKKLQAGPQPRERFKRKVEVTPESRTEYDTFDVDGEEEEEKGRKK